MKKIFVLFFAAILLISCDDGDIIVTDFNFDNQQLQWCGDDEQQVVFNINNDQVFEAIAFRFNLDTPTPQFFSTEEGQISVPLNSTNQVVYRVFDGKVENSYFCSIIPPVTPNVTEEFRSTSGGEVLITTTLKNATDHDGDGVPTATEGFEKDTDGDGIPDYLDIDDDGDNILTRVETEVEATNSVGNYPDSDNDGTPDYLDADDDNDGVITRYEDWNRNNNPADDQNEEGLPHYLNPVITDSFVVDTFRENSITRTFRYLFTVENLTLVNQGGDGEQIRLQNYELGYYDSPSQRITIEPAGTEDQ
ncbi:hypothetical protein [Salinimicrobium soli]|uniref:hypothetical protein n=1 Tax=Salinimicrobium soli TaxID=1254399 RepID=UPI003AAB1D59